MIKNCELTRLKGHLTTNTALAVSSCDQFLVTGSQDTKVKLWDTRANACVATFREHTGAINALQMSPDAKWVASGSSDGSLKIWDRTADKILANFAFPGQSVTCLQFNPQTLTLANGSTDRTVKFWDLDIHSMKIITKTSMDTAAISHLTFSEQNYEYLFTASADNIRLWNIENNQQLDCISVPPK